MSEVKRYGRIGDMVLATKGLLELYPDMTVYVKASDYDATQSELAALREELAEWKARAGRRTAERTEFINQRDDAQQRLTAAEQRNAIFQEAALDVISNLGEFCCSLQSQSDVDYITEQLDKLAALTQPTESGASE